MPGCSSSAGSTTTTQTTSGISIPCLLSFLAYQDIHATVQGIDSFAPDPTPPINLVFQVYHFMITVGPALAAIGVLAGLMFLWRRRLFESRFVLWLLVLTVFIGEATITAGWWTAEIGRQPWVVYDVLQDRGRRVAGPEPRLDVVLSLGMFVVLYGLLLVLFLYLLNRKIQDGPEELEEVETVAGLEPAGHVPRRLQPQPPRRRPGRRAMTLNDVWFFLFILIIAGYLILDGFDMGVGILLLPLARTDTERRTFLNSIGPVWDGNEVWLVLGGGVLFAVFPLAYASLFSGLYLAFVLVLLVMILRTVALEFRSKEPGKRWRSAWDTVFAVASAGLALLLGVAFGNIVAGLPLDADGNISTGLIGAADAVRAARRGDDGRDVRRCRAGSTS